MARPWGQVSVSVYETARLLGSAPWLEGHDRRRAWLLAAQHADGSWGGPDGYAVVPTLSAVEALLASGGTAEESAARRGLAWLADRLPRLHRLPDMPAIDLTVPSLVERIAARAHRLPLPRGLTTRRLDRVRQAAAGGAALPDKLLHAWEALGPAVPPPPAAARQLRTGGLVGASPAATAAVLAGSRAGSHANGRADSHAGNHAGSHAESTAAAWHLRQIAGRFGGPVPVAVPITVFERAWVLSWLSRCAVPYTPVPEMVADLHAAIGPAGTPAGPGLPADADTTAVALHALALLGLPHPPDSLLAFDTGEHIATWPGEDGASVTVNAHALDALTAWLRHTPGDARRFGPVAARLTAWLLERQHPDGWWEDRWHASPLYATMSAALALAEDSPHLEQDTRVRIREALRRAHDWIMAAQRPDGTWGRWDGTAEESAYAVLTLLLPPADPSRVRAARRAAPALTAGADRADHPPLWHDKDLYSPLAVVRAAITAACHRLELAVPAARGQGGPG